MTGHGRLLGPHPWLRRWAGRGALSILDQGLLSGSQFLISIVFARWLRPEDYGAFAAAFSVFLILSGFHNALILEPLSVLGPSRYADRLPAYLAAVLLLHVVLMAPVSAAVAAGGLLAGGSGLGRSLVALGLFAPLMLLLWLLRRICYLDTEPARALRGSWTYLAAVLLGLALARELRSPVTPLAVMAGASVAASLALCRPAPGRVRRPWALQRLVPVARAHWAYGKWVAAASVLNAALAQVQILVVAAVLGLEAAGVLRAMLNLILPLAQVITALATLALPALSHGFGGGNLAALRRKGRLITAGLVAAALAYEVCLVFLKAPLERLLYGGKFAGVVWMAPLLGMIPVLTAWSTGYSLMLRAAQRPEHHLVVSAAGSAAGLASLPVFIRAFGIWGAAASMVVGYGAAALATLHQYRRLGAAAPAAARFSPAPVATR